MIIETGTQASLLRFVDQTQLDPSERVISSSQRPLPAQHTTNTKDGYPFPQLIGTRDPSNKGAADLRFCHQDQLDYP